MSKDETLQIGQIVKSIRGRDCGTYAVVITLVDDRYALIADGLKRRVEKPKKKNRLHLEPTSIVLEDVRDEIQAKGRINNSKIRVLLDKFRETITEDQMKGEK